MREFISRMPAPDLMPHGGRWVWVPGADRAEGVSGLELLIPPEAPRA